jgi:GntR family transcriptional regulator/MocR family aminotransferase
MEPLLDLAIELPARGSGERLRALHRQLKQAIVDGRLAPGVKLPSTRGLAAALAVSRNTAVAAYDLLLGEGYLVTRHGAGTHVADVAAPARSRVRPSGADEDLAQRLNPRWRDARAVLEVDAHAAWRHDFRTGVPDTSALPFAIWQRLAGRALRRFAAAAPGYAAPAGQPALRAAIAQHVSFTRAVACAADDVVVTAGAQQAFDLLARILVGPGRTRVAVEDPGYPPLWAAWRAAGAELVPVPVDAEGLVVERLPPRVRIVCVTPSHQFPLGVAMSARRRAALLAFARQSGAVIVEDDYDGEFRHGGAPLDALQTLDRGACVFYVGTFSKSLFPALRIGYVVAPPWAQRALVAARLCADWHVPALAQDTLAAFIAEGHLARHVRRMRRVYAARHDALVDALARRAGGLLEPIPALAGLHVSARWHGRGRAGALAEGAARAGVAIEPLERYALGAHAAAGFAFGFARLDARDIDEAVRQLVAAVPAR